MRNILENLRIPTLLGLFILVLGTAAGVYLTLQSQTATSRAAPELHPKNITTANIEDQSAAISWQTDSASSGFVTFGANSPTDQTALDDRDSTTPVKRTTHHVSLTGLLPQTTYQFKIISGSLTYDTQKFTTAQTSTPNRLKPIIGSALDGDKPLISGIAYLQIDGALIQSAAIKNLGNFIIPISGMRKSDLSSILTPAQGINAKLTVYSEDGRKAAATFTLKDTGRPIGPLKLDSDLDLTRSSLGVSTKRIDVNGDGVINSFDLIPKKVSDH